MEGFQIEIGHGIFWMMMGIIAVLGLSLVYRAYYQRKTQTQYHHRLLEQFKAHQVTLEEILSLDYVPGDIISYLRQEKHILIQHPSSSSSL